MSVKRGKNCSSKCVTRDHRSFGECMRAKNIRLNPNLMEASAQKRWDSELDFYQSAKDQGLSPEGTTRKKVEQAFREAEATA